MLCAFYAGNITEIRYHNFQPQFAYLYFSSMQNYYPSIWFDWNGFMMVKFGMFSCYSRCCVGMTLGSENHVRCQTSHCTLIHSRSASLIRLQAIMQTCTSLNASYTGMIWPNWVHCEISSSCFPDKMTVKRKAQNDVRLERHQSNAWIMMTFW